MPVHDPHYHDCTHTTADGRPCKGKASMPAGDGRGFKCTRCGKVASEDELRRASLKRMTPDDD